MKALFTFLLALLLYTGIYSQWILQNPLTYQMDLTSVYFTDANNGFAIGDYGMLFRTTDAGIKWSADGHSPVGSKLNSVFIVSNTSEQRAIGYAAGNNGKIVKIDYDKYGSRSFLNQTSNVTVNLNSIFFTSEQTGYCGGNSGTILKTTNGGTNWVKLTTGTTYNLHSIYFVDSNTGYAAGGTNTNYVGIILKTTNAGNSWSIKYSGQSYRYLYSIHFENSTTGWASGVKGTILKTTNGGSSWSVQTSNVTPHLKSISFRDLQNGMAAGINGIIVKTTNGGTNWVKQTSGTTEQINSIAYLSSNKASAVGLNGFTIRTDNGGTSWQQHSIENHSSLGIVYFASANIGWINAGGLLYKTTDGGQNWNWKKVIDSMYISDFHFINTQAGWAAGANYILKTTDGGESWEVNFDYYSLNPREEKVLFESVYFVDNNYGWSSLQLLDPVSFYYNITMIFSTTDGGNSWQVVSTPDHPGTYSGFGKAYFQNKDTGFITGFFNNGHDILQSILYKTTDGGKNWVGYDFSPDGFEFSGLDGISFIDNKVFTVGGYEGYYGDNYKIDRGAMIISSTDGGQNWIRKDYYIPLDYYDYGLNSIHFPTSSVGYTVGMVIMKTTDGGNSWFLQNSPVKDYLNSVYFTDADNGWAVGGNGIILKHQKEPITAPLNWTAKIKFSHGDYLYDSLTFGQNSSATNNLDSQLGEFELPPFPPQESFDARFILPGDPTISTNKDIRNSSEKNITWNINLKYQGFPLKISWGSGDQFNLVPGEFYLIDGINGKDYLHINMKDTSQVILDSLPQYNSIRIDYYPPDYTITEEILGRYNDGWNLISIPLLANIMTTAGVFHPFYYNPSTSKFFGFNDKYFIAENLENGKGYWTNMENFDDPVIWPFSGVHVYHPVVIKKGWNLIGPFDNDVSVGQITTQPADIISTPFYGFDSRYFTASTLNVGKGYWVKSNSDGQINYNIGLGKPVELLADIKGNWGKITITDNHGSSSTLYDITDKEIKNLSQYELPPMPPNGVFDVRYNSGLMADKLNMEGKSILLNSASYPVSIRPEGIDLMVSYNEKGRQVEAVVSNGSRYVIEESSVKIVEVKRTADRTVPKEFTLHQNYPNPFNPMTKIKFDLPEKSRVNLSIYNILGERVTELVNKELEAGYHEIEFNASSLSSGVYFYRIDTEKNHKVKKMMLLK